MLLYYHIIAWLAYVKIFKLYTWITEYLCNLVKGIKRSSQFLGHFHFNPNKWGIPASTKEGGCCMFSSNYRAAHGSWRKTYNSPSFGTVSIQNSPPPVTGPRPLQLPVVCFPPMPLLWYCTLLHHSSTKEGACWRKKAAAAARFYFRYFAIFASKMKLFWSSY